MVEPSLEALDKALARAGEALSLAVASLQSGERVAPALRDLALVRDELVEARHCAERLEWAAHEGARRVVRLFAHEMRTPLNAIVGWTELLGRGAAASDRQAVEVIQRNAAALDRALSRMVGAEARPPVARVTAIRRRRRAASA